MQTQRKLPASYWEWASLSGQPQRIPGAQQASALQNWALLRRSLLHISNVDSAWTTGKAWDKKSFLRFLSHQHESCIAKLWDTDYHQMLTKIPGNNYKLVLLIIVFSQYQDIFILLKYISRSYISKQTKCI